MATTNLTLLGALAAGTASGLLATILLQSASTPDLSSSAIDPLGRVDASGPRTEAASASPVGSRAAPEWQDRLQALQERNLQLEQALIEVQERLQAIEADPMILGGQTGAESEADVSRPQQETTKRARRRQPGTIATLLEIGVDEQLAREITRREDTLELQRLELRDQAVRDGSYGSEAYYDQLQTLSDSAPEMRAEIGDEAYDRYLYAMGRANRVAISSVMAGSPAEQAGLKAGDIILRYADERIYRRAELRDATSAGERGEYVQISILRDAQPMSLLIPRGPLGVRMHSKRVRPAGS